MTYVDFCEEEEESDFHLLWYCKEAALFTYYNSYIYSCHLTIMFGDLRDDEEGKDLNNIIMTGKQIYLKLQIKH